MKQNTGKCMVTSVLLLIFLLGIILFVLHYQRLGFALLALGTLIFFLIGSGVLPYLLLKPLQPLPQNNFSWGKTNTIVVLGGGTIRIPHTDIVQPGVMSFSRLYQTAMVYQACKKSGNDCKIIISGGFESKTGMPEAQVYGDYLQNLGINPADIIKDPISRNTYENAKFTAEIFKTQKFDKIFLVTSGIHMRRALMNFSHFNIQVTPVPSDYLKAHLSIFPHGLNFAATDYAVHEYLGMIKFYLLSHL